MCFTAFKFPPKVNCLSLKKINILFQALGILLVGRKTNTLAIHFVPNSSSVSKPNSQNIRKLLDVTVRPSQGLTHSRILHMATSKQITHFDCTTPIGVMYRYVMTVIFLQNKFQNGDILLDSWEQIMLQTKQTFNISSLVFFKL